MEQYAIWWLNQESWELAEALGAPHSSWPEYIQKEFQSRGGRPGRGRLWIAPDIDFSGIAWQSGQKSFDMVGESYGGIVIRIEDLTHVVSWPGFISDKELKPVKVSIQMPSDTSYALAQTTSCADFGQVNADLSTAESITCEELQEHSRQRLEEIGQKLMDDEPPVLSEQQYAEFWGSVPVETLRDILDRKNSE